MENRGQSELNRFRPLSQLKRGFVVSILSAFPVLKGMGYFERDYGINSHLRVDSSGNDGMGNEKDGQVNHKCPRWLNADSSRF